MDVPVPPSRPSITRIRGSNHCSTPSSMEASAVTSWQWQDDQTTDILRDLRGFHFTVLHKDDIVWPQRTVGAHPTPRMDGQAWQYGQNLTTARYGWYPTNLVRQPPEHMLHKSQRPRAETPTSAEPSVRMREISDHRMSVVNLSPDNNEEHGTQSENRR